MGNNKLSQIFCVYLPLRKHKGLMNATNSYFSLNCNGQLVELDCPKVMGILNVTPDSFFSDSRKQSEAAVRARVRQILEEGGTFIDVGAVSTRPGATMVEREEEMERLRFGLSVVRAEAPEAIVSVDTFRADVAKMCVEEYGAAVINDISGGSLDGAMFKTIARLGVPYVLTHMQSEPTYENLQREVFLFFAERIQHLYDLGAKDIILDPGFGFGKTLEHNYELMARLEDFKEFYLPVLVGVSRKSMIYKALDCTPEEALNGTTALHAVALNKGAHILRVHDMKAALEVIKIHHRCSAFS